MSNMRHPERVERQFAMAKGAIEEAYLNGLKDGLESGISSFNRDVMRLIRENFDQKVCSCAWDGEYENCYDSDEFEDEAITKLVALLQGKGI